MFFGIRGAYNPQQLARKQPMVCIPHSICICTCTCTCNCIPALNCPHCIRRYFYIPARKEHRGIGGLFFDDLEAEGAPYDVQAYVQVIMSPACTAVKPSSTALLLTPQPQGGDVVLPINAL
jgi:hypothetical protein